MQEKNIRTVLKEYRVRYKPEDKTCWYSVSCKTLQDALNRLEDFRLLGYTTIVEKMETVIVDQDCLSCAKSMSANDENGNMCLVCSEKDYQRVPEDGWCKDYN